MASNRVQNNGDCTAVAWPNDAKSTRLALSRFAEAVRVELHLETQELPQLQLCVLSATSKDGLHQILFLLSTHQIKGEAEGTGRYVDEDV